MDGEVPSPVRPVNPAHVIFGREPGGCLHYLIDNGVTEKNARGVLGKWRGEYGDGAVIEIVAAASDKAVSNPIPWIEKALARRHGPPEVREVAPF